MKKTMLASIALEVLLQGSALAQQGQRSPNYTPYKTQNEEFMNTHQPGRIYDLSNGEYKSGQENKVFVDGYYRETGPTSKVTRGLCPAKVSRATRSP